MKVALVHELLTMKGGAENVLRIVADMFPDAPIYTLLYNESLLGDWFPASRVQTSAVQKKAERALWKPGRFNHHLYLKDFPRAVEAWNFDTFDVVLSSSSAFAHGIITNGKPKHLCYVHSPARYLWDRTHDVQARAAKGLLGPLKRRYLSRTFHDLRIWDSEAADRPDALLAASKIVQRRIELYWRRKSDVVYPPIDDVWFEPSHASRRAESALQHYLIVSSLVPYKRIELAIDACTALKRPLKVAGTGPAYASLKRRAGPTIEFLGYVPRNQLRELYASARATLFPGDEDFGLVPIESMACGTPVIAFRGGGALETLTDQTGQFFADATAESLAHAIETFEKKTFDSAVLRQQAGHFRRETFEAAINRHLQLLMTSR